MDQARLFRLMPEAIDITITRTGPTTFTLRILDRPAGVPWNELAPDVYELLGEDEVLDVLFAHWSSLT